MYEFGSARNRSEVWLFPTRGPRDQHVASKVALGVVCSLATGKELGEKHGRIFTVQPGRYCTSLPPTSHGSGPSQWPHPATREGEKLV